LYTDSCHPDDGGAKFLRHPVLTKAIQRNIPKTPFFIVTAVKTSNLAYKYKTDIVPASNTTALASRSVNFAKELKTVIPSDVSTNRAVGKANSYEIDDREIRVRLPVVLKIFSSPQILNRFWEPKSSKPMDTEGSFSGEKRPEREDNHSPPTTAQIKMEIHEFTVPCS
jgi:hypothetical protein